MSTLLETLRSRFAGNNLTGLRGEGAETKARTFPTPRLLELRAESRCRRKSRPSWRPRARWSGRASISTAAT